MRRFTPILSLAMILVFATAALACPMCKDSITDTANAAQQSGGASAMDAGIPTGFNYSVYLMLVGVFSMMALVIGVIAKGIRSANAAHARRGFEVKK